MADERARRRRLRRRGDRHGHCRQHDHRGALAEDGGQHLARQRGGHDARRADRPRPGRSRSPPSRTMRPRASPQSPSRSSRSARPTSPRWTPPHAPYTGSWSSIGSLDGPTQVRVVVTDVAGNGPIYSAPVTFTVDNTAPSVSLTAPASASGSTSLSAAGSADIASVKFEYSPHGAGSWSPIAHQRDRAVHHLLGDRRTRRRPLRRARLGNRPRRQPGQRPQDRPRRQHRSHRLALAPAGGTTVGGPAVSLAATAGDASGSGVASVEFQYRPAASTGAFTTAVTDTSAPYTGTWDVTTFASGSYELQILVTDNAGNVHALLARDDHDRLDSARALVLRRRAGDQRQHRADRLDEPGHDERHATASSPRPTPSGRRQQPPRPGPASQGRSRRTPSPTAPTTSATTVTDAFGNTTSIVVSSVVIDNTARLVSTDPADGSMLTAADTSTWSRPRPSRRSRSSRSTTPRPASSR